MAYDDGARFQEWYNPETGQVEIIDTGAHESPYEVAHREGRGDAFDTYVDELYTLDPEGDDATKAGVNLYDPNTYSLFPGQPTTTTPTPPRPTLRSSGGGGGGGFSWPTFRAPRFQAPPPFSYEAFKAPSIDEAMKEPGYELARSEGIRALVNDKAAQGIRRTGGSLKDLTAWGNRFAEQNYSRVFDRAANTWSMNRNNAADNYMTNYGVSRDVFDRDYRAAVDEFMPVWDAARYTFDDNFRRWQTAVNANATLSGRE